MLVNKEPIQMAVWDWLVNDKRRAKNPQDDEWRVKQKIGHGIPTLLSNVVKYKNESLMTNL